MKKWYQSKTIVVNIIAGLLGIIPSIDMNLLNLFGVGNATQYLAILGLITTIANIVLRSITSESIIGAPGKK